MAQRARERRASSRPAVPPALALAVAVAAVSWSGPLVRFTAAPALAIAAWRLVFSVALVGVLAAATRSAHAPARLRRGDTALVLVAGLLLAGHFWSWIASLRYTSVASSVVLVSMQPIFVGTLSAVGLRERPTPRQWIGIAVAVAGAVVIGGGDLGRGRDPLLGDGLALAGALFGSGYFVIGRRLRPRLGIWTYTGIVYGVTAATLLVAAAATATPLFGYAPSDWGVFALLALGPMMLGHTGVNYALRYVPAYVANLALLGEAVGATLLAWALPAIAERPPVQTVVGGAITLAGIALGVRTRQADGRSRHVEGAAAVE